MPNENIEVTAHKVDFEYSFQVSNGVSSSGDANVIISGNLTDERIQKAVNECIAQRIFDLLKSMNISSDQGLDASINADVSKITKITTNIEIATRFRS